MKTKALPLFALAAALIGTAACTNDDNVAVDNNDPVAARITASVGNVAVATPDTRAVDNHWNADHIGVIVTSSPGNDMATDYRNAHYTTASTSATADFTPATPAHTIYFSGPEVISTFAAYAPYQPSDTPGTLPGPNADGVIPVNTTTQTDATEQEALDFLYAAGATASKDAPLVHFNAADAGNDHSFHHVMSRLELIIETPEEYGFAATQVTDISNVSLGLLAQSGTFDVKTGIAATAGATSAWDITDNVNNTSATGTQRTYTLILLPQQVKNAAGAPSAVPISLTLDGLVYQNLRNITGSTVNDEIGFFLPGTSYEYTIRLRKTDLEVTNATITPWITGSSDTGDAILPE